MAVDKIFASQQTLYQLMTLDFVQASIADLAEVAEEVTSPAFPKIIRCIALMNIVSRRLSGQVSQRQGHSGDLSKYVRESVRRIALYYKAHATEWEFMQRGCLTGDSVHKLAGLLELRMGRARLEAIDCDADEVVHDVLVGVLDGRLSYSFDMPLSQWLTMHLVRTAWQNSAYAPSRRDGVMLNEAVVNGTHSRLTSPSYEDDPAAWDVQIDLQLRMKKLTSLDQSILRMRLEHKDRHEIAQALNVTPKTVSNHWTYVLRTLRSE